MLCFTHTAAKDSKSEECSFYSMLASKPKGCHFARGQGQSRRPEAMLMRGSPISLRGAKAGSWKNRIKEKVRGAVHHNRP